MSHEHKAQWFYVSVVLQVYIQNTPVQYGLQDHLAQWSPQLLIAWAGFGTLSLWARRWSRESVSRRTCRFQAEVLGLNPRLCLRTPAGNAPPSAQQVNTAQCP